MTGQSDNHTCALRALTLCDGQVLEDPDHAPTECLCTAIASANRHGPCARGLLLAETRAKLIEECMAPPLDLWPSTPF